jgi:hypothetical protein
MKNTKQITAINLDDFTIKLFPSIARCSRDLNINMGTISQILNGKLYKTHQQSQHGKYRCGQCFTFKYNGDHKKVDEPCILNIHIPDDIKDKEENRIVSLNLKRLNHALFRKMKNTVPE